MTTDFGKVISKEVRVPRMHHHHAGRVYYQRLLGRSQEQKNRPENWVSRIKTNPAGPTERSPDEKNCKNNRV